MVRRQIKKGFGLVILIFIIAALAGEAFTALESMGTDTPTWLVAGLVAVAGAALMYVVAEASGLA